MKSTKGEPILLDSYQDILLIIGCHYILKNQFYGNSKEQIFSELMCEIDDFNLDDVASCAIQILGTRDKSNLN